ncbi:hypothetical protein SAMN02745166_02222 [Prosthecobacter debontii]|uniref:Lipoprotein n=1 Tax=Prosthecobacter debontii TaxID=48467 RepID=A0A1T4Y069_9BACT|nr:hypothetical protein [Prosthecobacter debontii]SKA94858.1 hypothetical protein SAMN02745166_02222 [Prosthecobacter debontii]
MILKPHLALLLGCSVTFSSCRSFDSLIEISRMRAAAKLEPGGAGKTGQKQDRFNRRAAATDITLQYTVTDLDVLNFTNGVKNHLDRRSSIHTNLRYGSATTMATLGGLAGAAKTVGWSTGTASALGLGATYVFGLGQIFNSKSHAQAYEQCLADVQAAEASYFFYRLGGRANGTPEPANGIPSATHLTYEGEVLYYRVTKVLNVLYDSLAGKIPDLQDLKEARGEGTAGQATSKAPTPPTPPNQQAAAATEIPAVLKPRNERLETAFTAMNEVEYSKAHPIIIPPGSTLKQHLATLILAKADLPIPAGKDALEGLTFYRKNATTEAQTAKLESAYRAYHVLPPAQ